MAWVSWNSVCKPKELGGIGIKDVGLFDKDLPSKWLWCFIKETYVIWCGILESRYGNIIRRIMSKDASRVLC